MRSEPWSDKANLTAFLQEVPVLRGIQRAQLLALSAAGWIENLSSGWLLFSQSDDATSAYIVKSGCIDLVLSTPDGRELAINSMGPGELFGELGVITGRSRSATAVARQPSQVVTIPGEDFLLAIEEDPLLMRRILETTSQRLGISSQREGALAFLSADARVARILLQLSARQLEQPDLVTISQLGIAQRVGVTRQTVAKVLGRWRRKGVIITGRGKIMLVDRAALHRLAEEETI